MKSAWSMVALFVIAGCASIGHREQPDLDAIDRAVETAANGNSEKAIKLADAAVADCGAGLEGFDCALSTRVTLAERFTAMEDEQLAVSQARSAVSLADEYGDASSQWPALDLLATTSALANQLDEADAAHARAAAIVSDLEKQVSGEDVKSIALARGTLDGSQALIHLMKGNPAEAANSQARFIEALRANQPDHPNLSEELLHLAALYEAAGDTQNAVKTLQSAATLAKELGDTEVEEQARSTLAELSESD